MSKVVQVSRQDFQSQVLDSSTPVVLDFYAPWCAPCRTLGPVLDQLSNEFAGQIKFVKINSDEEPELSEAFNVTALPTLVFIENGEAVGHLAGLPQTTALRSRLQEWLKAVSH